MKNGKKSTWHRIEIYDPETYEWEPAEVPQTRDASVAARRYHRLCDEQPGKRVRLVLSRKRGGPPFHVAAYRTGMWLAAQP